MNAQELLQTKKNFETLLESVTDYVVGINRNYQIIMANGLFKNEFGFEPDTHCFKSWKHRDKKCEECPVERSFQDGKIHLTEQTVVMKDGRLARLSIKSTPVKDEQGTIVYVLETATDITEKERFQGGDSRIPGELEDAVASRLRELQKSEESYRAIFDRSSDAIMLTDRRGNILEINQAGAKLLGQKTKEELHQLKPVFELFEKKEDVYNLQKRIIDEGFVPEFEARLVGQGNKSFYALITFNLIFDLSGQITNYLITIRDISDRKKALAQIEQHNRRLATLNAISTTLTSSLDLNEVLDKTIEKMLEILEPDSVRIYLLDKKRVILVLVAHKGLSQGFVEEPHIKVREPDDGLLGKVVTEKRTRVANNLERSEDPYVSLLVKEGLKSSIYMPLMSKGEPIGAMVVSSHSSFKFSSYYIEYLGAIGNQIGIALENADLYRDLKIAYQELKEAQEQIIASEKLASLGKLSATIAHEINNPLAAVLTYIRLLLKMGNKGNLKPERKEDILKYLNTMESETARCGEIVKNLLAFSRQSKVTIETHRIEDIIDKSLTLIAHDLEMREIELVKEIEKGLPDVKCDFRQIQQALINLLSNASEAMFGGGTLSVSARTSEKKDYIEVAVSDTGCGIDEKDLPHIFEPFFTTKEEGKGVGLGLSVVYGIVTRHKGTIEATSSPDKGTTFTMRLPVAES